MLRTLTKAAPVVGDASKALDKIVDAWSQYKFTAEVEQTKRESIRATRDINIKMIEENAAILKTYLDGAFKERAGVINGMFERLDKGLAEGNAELASNAMAAIVAVTKESPLAGARELLVDLRNPQVTSIEI
ncbi:hypothetical protein [Massilia sp. H6]|uniref:hypothetical protein n=1 Tax=Massilia sp. H6 TaxID=2970464 RepID=UPI0021685182|nr:hypothetical protein [Massilia sp. H6]UVW30694.1 hypothetical protein NRS07_20255 [Massilia sp. H6]